MRFNAATRVLFPVLRVSLSLLGAPNPQPNIWTGELIGKRNPKTKQTPSNRGKIERTEQRRRAERRPRSSPFVCFNRVKRGIMKYRGNQWAEGWKILDLCT